MAAHHGHLHVHQHDVERAGLQIAEATERLRAGITQRHLRPLVFEQPAADFQIDGAVINHHDVDAVQPKAVTGVDRSVVEHVTEPAGAAGHRVVDGVEQHRSGHGLGQHTIRAQRGLGQRRFEVAALASRDHHHRRHAVRAEFLADLGQGGQAIQARHAPVQ